MNVFLDLSSSSPQETCLSFSLCHHLKKKKKKKKEKIKNSFHKSGLWTVLTKMLDKYVVCVFLYGRKSSSPFSNMVNKEGSQTK